MDGFEVDLVPGRPKKAPQPTAVLLGVLDHGRGVHEDRDEEGRDVKFKYLTSNDLAKPIEDWSQPLIVRRVISDPDVDGDGQTELVTASFPISQGSPALFVLLEVRD